MSRHSAKQLTLRGIPHNLYRDLVREARRRRTSVNKLLLERLLPPQRERAHGHAYDLLALSGTWDADRAADFETSLHALRQIDPELWQ